MMMNRNNQIFDDSLNEIIKLYNLNKFDIAESKSRSLIKKHPKSIVIRKVLGNILSAQKKFKESLICFKNILKVKSNDPDALNNLGAVYKEMDQQREAIKYFQKAIEAYPKFTIAYNNLGNAYKRDKQFIKAINSYQQAIKIKPDYAIAYFNLAATQQTLGKNKDAIYSCAQAIKIKPNYQNAHYVMGNLFKKNANYKEAFKHFKKVKSPVAKANELECQYLLKEKKEYNKNLEEILKNDKTNLSVAALNAYVSHQQKTSDTYPFCPNPLSFIYTKNIKYNFKSFKTFLRNFYKNIQMNNLLWEPSGHTTRNGYRTIGNLFDLNFPEIINLKRIILAEVEKYKLKYIKRKTSFYI